MNSCEYQPVNNTQSQPKKSTKVYKMKHVFANAPKAKKEKVINKVIS